MDLWFLIALACLSFALGLCFGGILANGSDGDEYIDGYNDGLTAGRKQTHEDYQR